MCASHPIRCCAPSKRSSSAVSLRQSQAKAPRYRSSLPSVLSNRCEYPRQRLGECSCGSLRVGLRCNAKQSAALSCSHCERPCLSRSVCALPMGTRTCCAWQDMTVYFFLAMARWPFRSQHKQCHAVAQRPVPPITAARWHALLRCFGRSAMPCAALLTGGSDCLTPISSGLQTRRTRTLKCNS